VNLPSIQLQQLAGELRRLRAESGKTQEAAAAAASVDRATLSKVENARACPHTETLNALLDLYGVEGSRRAQLQALRDSGQSSGRPIPVGITEGYETFIDLEYKASAVNCYEALVIPGQLQTQGYTRAHAEAALHHASEVEIATRVSARMERQRRFLARRPQFAAILTEAALRYRVGGPEVMRAQLARLLEASAESNFTLQIIPQGAEAHPSMSGGFCALYFEQNLAVVYFETATEARFLHQPEEVQAYSEIFQRLARVALDPAGTQLLIARLLEEGDTRC
jgi:transcriptional regulator with XRE-family HTH domain